MDIDVEGAVLELRTEVFRRTALTCSAGIAPNFKCVYPHFTRALGQGFTAVYAQLLFVCRLAEICADRNKPDGQYRLPPTKEAVSDFVASGSAGEMSTPSHAALSDQSMLNQLLEEREMLRSDIQRMECKYCTVHYSSFSVNVG